MSNIDRATLVINETYADEYVKMHMTPLKVAQALADAGLLAPDPQIIRTVEEQEALDPDTLLMSRKGYIADAEDNIRIPAAVLVPADQVRTARKALEEA